MGRLILLSGAGGAGTTTLAHATVDALAAEGCDVRHVDGSVGGLADANAVAAVAGAVGGLFSGIGADPLVPQGWSALPGMAHVSTLLRAAEALAEADVVVVDCGPYTRFHELIDLPAVLLRLLDAALTPRTAMWRTAGGDDAFTALSAARSTVALLQAMLMRPTTTARLVSAPTTDSAERTMTALATSSLLGVGVEGIVVNRFPSASHGASKRDVRTAASVLAGIRDAAGDVPVWKSTSRLRPAPKGQPVAGSFGRVHVLDAEQLTVHVGTDEFRIELPLAGPAREGATVGVQGHWLVVAFDSAWRWIELPPVLRRCRPVHADRTGFGLTIAFRPDPGLWRAPAAETVAS